MEKESNKLIYISCLLSEFKENLQVPKEVEILFLSAPLLLPGYIEWLARIIRYQDFPHGYQILN